MKLFELLTSPQEWLTAAVGSTLFWLTLCGMAARARGIDFKKIDDRLEAAFKRAEGARFSVVDIARAVLPALLRTLYGSTTARTFLAVAAASTVLQAYVFTLLYADWARNKERIALVESSAIRAVSPEYFELISTTEGQENLSKAFSWPEFVSDEEERRIKRVHEDFRRDLRAYGRDHHISYELMLSRWFGDSFLNIRWRSWGRWNQMSALFAIMVIAGAVVDTAAVIVTLRLIDELIARAYIKALVNVPIALGLFFLSLSHFGTILRGFEATVASGLFMVSLCYIQWRTRSLPKPELWGAPKTRRARWLIAAGCLLLVAVSVWLAPDELGDEVAEWRDVALFPFTIAREWIQAFRDGIDSRAVLLGSMTLLPILIAVIFVATLGLAKLIYVPVKEVALGQIYGVTVLSRGTYFVGFLTTLVSFTTLVVFLIRLFG